MQQITGILACTHLMRKVKNSLGFYLQVFMEREGPSFCFHFQNITERYYVLYSCSLLRRDSISVFLYSTIERNKQEELRCNNFNFQYQTVNTHSKRAPENLPNLQDCLSLEPSSKYICQSREFKNTIN